MNAYATFTSMDINDLLQVNSSSENTTLFFWSTVVGLGPDAYVDDTEHNYTPTERRVGGGSLDSISDLKMHQDDLRAADKQAHSTITPTYCKAWQGIHDRLATAEKARYDDAANHGIDDAATQWVRTVETELADTQAFFSREVKYFKPPLQNLQKISADNFDRMRAATIEKLKVFVHARGDEFLLGQQRLRNLLEEEQRNINVECGKVLNPPNFDRLAQDEWQNVLAHFSSDFDSNADCIIKIDSAKIEFNEKENAKVSAKWGNVNAKLDLMTNARTTERKWQWEGKVAGSESSEDAEDEAAVGVTASPISKDNLLVGVTVGGQAEQGPITVKGNVTLMSDTNPMTGVKEPAVGFSGTAGIGIHGKVGGIKAGVDCFPGKGSATVYPRGLLQDAMNYLVAASR